MFDVLQGTQIDKLTQNNGASFEKLGHSVAINEDLILSGALEAFDDSPVATRTGSAFLFSATQAADFEEDGVDFLIWQRQFETPSVASRVVQVPEPGSFCLLLPPAGQIIVALRRA